MIYVNKMDIMGADFYHVLDMVHDRLKCNAVPIQLPIGTEADFRGIIDLVEMNARIYYDDLGNDMRTEEIPRGYARSGRGIPCKDAGSYLGFRRRDNDALSRRRRGSAGYDPCSHQKGHMRRSDGTRGLRYFV